jgi:DNA-binding XRE family transcriptional regulator
MPKVKSLGKEESLKLRHALSDRAHNAELKLPAGIYEMRKSVGLSQEKFAGMLKMTRRQIAEIENGKANPTLETLNRIGRLFGFEVGFIPKNRRE